MSSTGFYLLINLLILSGTVGQEAKMEKLRIVINRLIRNRNKKVQKERNNSRNKRIKKKKRKVKQNQ